MSLPEQHRQRSLRVTVLLLLGIMVWLITHWPHNGLWYDEALTTYVANDSWATLWHWCTQVDIQVPFHYVVLRLWTALIGNSEFSLRALSALSAFLAVAATVALGKKLTRGTVTGGAAALMLSATPGFLWIAYEVRAYALGLALYAWATVFLAALVRDQQRDQRRWWVAVVYAVLMLATLYTHYTALAGFAAHLVILLVLALRQVWINRAAGLSPSRLMIGAFWPTVVVALLVSIGFALWLPTLLTRGSADRSFFPGDPILPQRSLAVMLTFKLVARDQVLAELLPMVLAYAALMILGIALVAWPARRRNALPALFGAMITLWPVALVAALVYFKPKLAGRYAWPAWIGFDLLASLPIAGLVRLRRGAIPAIAVLVVVLAVPWTFPERGHPPESDYRGAFAYLCEHGTPQDIIALRDGTLFVTDLYYGRRPPCDAARRTVALPPALMTNVDQYLLYPLAQSTAADIVAVHPPNVWVIAWQGDTMDPQALAYGLLDTIADHTVVARMFGDIRLDRYENVRSSPVDLRQGTRAVNLTPVSGGPILQSVRLFAPEIAHAGDTLVVHAWWIRGDQLQPDLRASARLTTMDGGWTYAQVDQPPAGWKYVDDRWLPGVPALGRYELVVGPDVPVGEFAVRYRLYDAAGLWPPQTVDIGTIRVTTMSRVK